MLVNVKILKSEYIRQFGGTKSKMELSAARRLERKGICAVIDNTVNPVNRDESLLDVNVWTPPENKLEGKKAEEKIEEEFFCVDTLFPNMNELLLEVV